MGKEKHGKGLAKELGKIYEEEIQKGLDREVDEAEYMNQEEFVNCTARASAMSQKARARCNFIYGLAILNHREKEHGEDHKKEREALESQLVKEDIALASTRGWWKN